MIFEILPSHPGGMLGFMLLVEDYRRLQRTGVCQSREVLRIDGSYCLDAPEVMPAGGCEYDSVDDEFLPAQMIFHRSDDDAS